ncbi:hypothetical protein F2Q70_00029631 [Brassica cretica]|uniref:Uncharacterized protein n=1 Tax=Brassica cretica TaxID=69181 RepID=A0A8S9FJ59_BRACR|nr:hypothetical protein F2Q70_00029631 [Brassica cretica]
MKKAMSDKDKMYDKMQQTIGRLFYPLHNSIAWIIKTMEELQQKLDYTEWIIQRQQYHITKSEKAIKSFVVDIDRQFTTATDRSSLQCVDRHWHQPAEMRSADGYVRRYQWSCMMYGNGD